MLPIQNTVMQKMPFVPKNVRQIHTHEGAAMSIDTVREALKCSLQAMYTDRDQVSHDCDCRVCRLRAEAITKVEQALAALSIIEDERTIWEATVERLQKFLKEADPEVIRRECADAWEREWWGFPNMSLEKLRKSASEDQLEDIRIYRAAILGAEPERKDNE